VGFPHVRVGHCQALYLEEPRTRLSAGFFYGYKGVRSLYSNLRGARLR